MIRSATTYCTVQGAANFRLDPEYAYSKPQVYDRVISKKFTSDEFIMMQQNLP